MKKETFIKIMKECIKHAEEAERMGDAMKELVSTRSTLKDFMDGFDTIFYDDQMVENIIRSLESELEDEDELITTWFYEYRTMGALGSSPYMEVAFKEKCADVTFRIGTNPEEDDVSLGLLYEAVTRK